MNKLLVGLLVVAAIGLTLFFFWSDIQAVFGTREVAAASLDEEPGKDKGDKKNKGKEGKEDEEDHTAARVKVLERWELPGELVEISGIAFSGRDEVAAVQDEEGRLYFYNLDSRKVTRQVPFAGPGDYEGIAVVGKTAWVIRADGVLYEIEDHTAGKPKVSKHVTGLTRKQDVEGLTYDKKNNRLLLAIKGQESGSADYKGIYAFNLKSRKMDKSPAYRIELGDPVFSGVGGKKKEDVIQPSDLAVHPATGEVYVVDGAKPKMLVLDATGKPKHLYKMKGSDFPQPEGIDFNEAGELFISNEGGKGQGTILKVELP